MIHQSLLIEQRATYSEDNEAMSHPRSGGHKGTRCETK